MSRAPKRPIGIVGKAFSFEEVMAEAARRLQDEEAKVAAMTPAELEEYQKQRAEEAKEVEKLLGELGKDPGFFGVRAGEKS